MFPFRSIRMRMLALGLGIASTAPAMAQTVAHTVTVREEVELGVPPGRAWDAIRDYLAWPAWHPAFASTKLLSGDGRSRGSVRLLTAKDGAQFTEELMRFDAVHHRLKYRILESPAPVIGYESTLEVKPSKAGSTVVWSSRFQVREGTPEADAKRAIAGIYRLGLDNLATAIE
jgi:Polyketide cyclase / dehydrase and lipid transport